MQKYKDSKMKEYADEQQAKEQIKQIMKRNYCKMFS